MSAVMREKTRASILAGELGVLFATNRWRGWTAGMRLVSGHDQTYYRLIAVDAPRLPQRGVPNQIAQDFAPSYVVGLLSHATGIGVDTTFRIVVILIILGICLCLHTALTRAGVSTPVYAICAGVMILNTYAFRYYLLVPGSALDLSFVLAIGLALNALISRRYMVVLMMIALAALCRQTALPLVLPVAWWVAFAPGWRDAPARVRVLRAGGIVGAPLVAYAVVIAISSSFSVSTTPGLTELTVLGDFEHLPTDLGALIQHVARVVNPLFAVIALGGVGLGITLRRAGRRPAPIPFVAWGAALIGLFIVLEPLALNTNYSGHPERLAVLSLLPFVISVAYLLRRAEDGGLAVSPRAAWLCVAILALGSLHYLYTAFGPSTRLGGALLQLVAACLVATIVWRSYRSSAPA
jgi:hypothetical protein